MNFLKKLFNKSKQSKLNALYGKLDISRKYIEKEENDLNKIDVENLSKKDKNNFEKRKQYLQEKKEEYKKNKEKYDLALEELEEKQDI